jgi:Divergent InlB B-repeat domain
MKAEGGPRPRSRRLAPAWTRRFARWSAFGLVSLLLLVAFAGPGAATHPGPPNLVRAGPPAPGAAPPPGMAPSSGRGSFFASTPLAKAPASDDACYTGGTCVNGTSDPSINLTSNGVLAVAYTSYSDVKACGVTDSEIAVVTSTDLGQAWSSPTYLNNPQCASSANDNSHYNNSWEPALTSLANGTLVLAYIQYNSGGFAPDLEWDYNSFAGSPNMSYNVPYDRLVLTESYDNGVSWTTPQVINASNNPSLTVADFWSPLRPSVTAIGQTIYLAWTAMNTALFPNTAGGTGVGAMNATFEASINGGTTWSAPVILPTFEATHFSFWPSTTQPLPMALNPSVAVLPDGELEVAYVGNVSAWERFDLLNFTSPSYCGQDPGGWACAGGQIFVGRSTNNGTSFSYTPVPLDPDREPVWINNVGSGSQYGFAFTGGAGSWGGQNAYDSMYPLVDPAPQMVYDDASGQLFVTYEGGIMTYNTGYFTPMTVFVSNSSDGGAAWAMPTQVAPDLIQPGNRSMSSPLGYSCAYNLDYGCYSQAMGDASLAISNGSLVVEFGYLNYSACGMDNSGNLECGMVQELLYTSSDNGATFQSDGVASGLDTIDDGLYPGASSSALGVGSQLWVAWTNPWCPDWQTSVCLWPLAGPDGPEVMVSQPFSGVGLTIQFQESGLPSWLTWNSSIAANLRSSVGPAPQSISGVPSGSAFGWFITAVNGPYGSVYTATTTPAPGATFTSNATVRVDFSPAFTGNVSVTVDQTGLPSWIPWNVTFGGVPRSVSGHSTQFIGVPGNASLYWYAPDAIGPYGSVYVPSFSTSAPGAFTTNGTLTVSYSPAFIGNTTVQFAETGLPAGQSWSIDFGGTTISGSTASLTVPGVPIGQTIAWALPDGGQLPSSNPDERFSETSVNASSPTTFTGATTIGFTFLTQYRMNVTTSPYIPSCGDYDYDDCLDSPYQASYNYNVTVTTTGGTPQAPGNATWVSAGSGLNATFAVTHQDGYCAPGYGYYDGCTETNLTFLGWVGTGNGSVTTDNESLSVPADGPITEAALFDIVSTCLVTPDRVTLAENPYSDCANASYTLSFVETGLPNGTEWGAATSGSITGNVYSGVSSTDELNLSNDTNSGRISYQVWTIPASGGQYWASVNMSPASPIELPGDGVVHVQFALVAPASVPASAQVRETGLPAWVHGYTVLLGSSSYGITGTMGNYSLAGGTYSVGADPVYLANGTGYHLTSVTEIPGVLNWTDETAAADPLASVAIEGPAVLYLNFAPTYFVNVQVGFGGASTNGSAWVDVGGSVRLTATPATQYAFVAWTGLGNGSVNATARTITVFPAGPITEIAGFRYIPVPGFTATVSSIGLPAGTSATVVLGGRAYTAPNGGSSFNVTALNGSYALTVPTVFLGGSNLTRFVPVGISTSFPESGNALTIAENGTITITYETQYLVRIFALGNGTVSPVAGSLWENASQALTLTATPWPHNRLEGWAGNGTGSVSSTALAIDLTVSSPVIETATFAFAPASAAARYTLTVTESGLPADVNWSFAVGTSSGCAGVTTSLTLAGLNGSYVVSVPDVAVGTGTVYVPNWTSAPVTVGADRILTMTFSAEYWVSVANSTGGTATASAVGWVAAGTVVSFTATPSGGWELTGWTGGGPGSVSAKTDVITVTVTSGPVSEDALFGPTIPGSVAVSSGSSTTGVAEDVGLLIGLLVVGLILAFLVTRPRGRKAAPPQPATDSIVWDEPKAASPPAKAPAKSVPETEDDEDEE